MGIKEYNDQIDQSGKCNQSGQIDQVNEGRLNISMQSNESRYLRYQINQSD